MRINIEHVDSRWSGYQSVWIGSISPFLPLLSTSHVSRLLHEQCSIFEAESSGILLTGITSGRVAALQALIIRPASRLSSSSSRKRPSCSQQSALMKIVSPHKNDPSVFLQINLSAISVCPMTFGAVTDGGGWDVVVSKWIQVDYASMLAQLLRWGPNTDAMS